MADLSQIPTDQLMAMAQQQQANPLANVPTEQLMAMAQNHPDAQDNSFMGQLGHQLGLTGRYALEGAGNLAGVVSDPLGQFLPGYQKTGELASSAADALGLPKPQGSLEKTVGAASKALVGTGLTAGLGGAAGAAELAAQPGTQAASAILGGVGEEKGGAAGGLIGSLLGGAPAGLTGLSKLALRGGEAGQQRMAQNLENFAAAGTTPTVGQATEGGIPRFIESFLSKMPGSAGVMAKKAQTQGEDIGQRMTQYADQLAPGTDPTQAGAAIVKGISGEGGFVDRFKADTKALYDAVDQHMPGDTGIAIPATQNLLAKLTTPIKGAEATSGVLANPKLQSIANAIGEDTQNSQLAGLGDKPLPAGSVTFGPDGTPQLGAGGTMPYTAIKQLRTKVGDMIADAGLISDVPKAQLKQLYGSLSEDMRNGLKNVSPEAFAANNIAERAYRAGIDHIDAVDSVIGKAGGPEKVYAAALSGTRDGATTLNSVMSALKPEQQDIVTSAVVRRMGMANPGAQNDAGNVFSTQSFLTNWNTLSPQAKQALFKNDSEIRQNLDKIAAVTSNLKEGSKVFAQNSGTAPAEAQIKLGLAAMTAIAHPPAAVPIIAGLGATNLGARLMTNADFVKWLARNTTAPIGVLPAQIGYLDQLGQQKKDPDLTSAAQMLASTGLATAGSP